MWKIGLKLSLTTLIALGALNAQVLTGDTLVIGTVYGCANQQVVVPVYMKSSVPYQGWQIPLKFGSGSAPLHCDSLSYAGSCMMSVPHEWDFIADFVNNNQWDNVHACGVAALVDFYSGETLPAGFWLVMKLYITIGAGAQPQTIAVDTASARWNASGPLNSYMVTVASTSRMTVVRPGSLHITLIGVEEGAGLAAEGIQVSPNPVTAGAELTITCPAHDGSALAGSIIDASGRVVDRFTAGPKTGYKTGRLSRGVYFVVLERGGDIVHKKIVVR